MMKPLEEAVIVDEPSAALIAAARKKYPLLTDKGIRELLDREIQNCEYWMNDIYQVEVRRFEDKTVHLNIRRRDGAAIMRDWRHFQQIKNQLIGENCEAVELYPAEDRLVDTSNKYHLYGSSDPTFRFPFGFTKRDVNDADELQTAGTRQRAFENEGR